MHAHNLGGIDGQIQTLSGCTAFGGSATRGPSLFVPCVEGLQQFTVNAATRLIKSWQQSLASGSPVVGGQTVYSLNPDVGVLYAFNSANGQVRAKLAVGTTSRFATPTLFGRTVLIGTMSGIVAAGIR